MTLTVAFAGTPAFAAEQLQALIAADIVPRLVITQPDRPAGRGRSLTSPAVRRIAIDANIPCIQPAHIKQDDCVDLLRTIAPDILVVVAYGCLLPETVLTLPRYGCLNIHLSLLPKWRGAAPVARAIQAGDTTTGISFMRMDSGLDTGPIYAQHAIAITAKDTCASLTDKLSILSQQHLPLLLSTIANGECVPQTQDHSIASHAPKLTKREAQIDWHQSAQQIVCMVRAFNPRPVAQCSRDHHIIRVWQARVYDETGQQAQPGEIIGMHNDGLIVATGQGSVCLERIQRPGGKAASCQQVVRGYSKQLYIGARFG